MEYSRPNDITSLSLDELAAIKDKLRSELTLVEEIIDHQVESVCRICESFGYAYEDIPAGWGWLYKEPALLCDKCIDRWTERFGAPKVHREGDIEYEYIGVPKDSTHWGQANFEFV